MLQVTMSVYNRPRPVGADPRDYGYLHVHVRGRGLGSVLPLTQPIGSPHSKRNGGFRALGRGRSLRQLLRKVCVVSTK